MLQYALIALAAAGNVSGFSTPQQRNIISSSSTSTARFSTLVEPPTTTTTSTDGNTPPIVASDLDDLSKEPTAWECNDEAECVVVPACDEEDCRTSLDVRVHGTWYDLSGWRKAHPAGAHWIDWYDGRDATEVMDAFHSQKGREMYKRLPKSAEETAAVLEASSTPYSTVTTTPTSWMTTEGGGATAKCPWPTIASRTTSLRSSRWARARPRLRASRRRKARHTAACSHFACAQAARSCQPPSILRRSASTE